MPSVEKRVKQGQILKNVDQEFVPNLPSKPLKGRKGKEGKEKMG